MSRVYRSDTPDYLGNLEKTKELRSSILRWWQGNRFADPEKVKKIEVNILKEAFGQVEYYSIRSNIVSLGLLSP